MKPFNDSTLKAAGKISTFLLNAKPASLTRAFPLITSFIVLIFAELAPMFAARRFAENVVMLGMPFLYITAIIMRPITWVLNLVYRLTYYLFSDGTGTRSYISREELQKAIEEREDAPIQIQRQEFDAILLNLFSLKNKKAKDLMQPVNRVKLIASESQIRDFRALLGLEVIVFFIQGQVVSLIQDLIVCLIQVLTVLLILVIIVCSKH